MSKLHQTTNPTLKHALETAMRASQAQPAHPAVQGQPQISLQELEMQEGVLGDYIKQAEVSLKTLAQVCDRNAEVIAALGREKEAPGRVVSDNLLDAMAAYVHACSIREDLAMSTTRRQLAQFEGQLTQIRQMRLAMGVVG